MSLGILILNYRTPKLTLDCLASLAPCIGEIAPTRVVLVDNNSGDDSLPILKDAIAKNGWDSWLTLAESASNRGFAGGNNFAMSQLTRIAPDCEFVLLLNSDTLMRPGTLGACVEKMRTDKSVGVLSCLLQNRDGTGQTNARKFPTPARMAAASLGLPWLLPGAFGWANLEDPRWNRTTAARDVDWVGGAFMLIRRAAWDQVGPLDERFFFYGEDAEFCHRIRRHHWKVRYDPAVAIVHLGGASSESAAPDRRERNELVWQARYLLQRRCYGPVAEIFLRAVDIFSFGLRYLKLLIRGRKNTPECAVQRDVLAILLSWPVAGKGCAGS